MKTINRLISSVMIATAGVAVSSAAVITGSLRDPETGEGEPYATVRIYRGTSAEGSPLVTSTTDIDGNFSETLTRAGDYTVVFNSFGKKAESRLITVGPDGDISLGDIEMLPAPTMLNEVTVTAQRPLVKMTADKVAYNVAEDADSKTNTLLDMLRKMPMVAVDGEDNITVNGSGNFKVYVDGRPSLMFSSNPSQIFKSMPATSVQSVEVIVNPGAQFDAEGAGGVINLVMNKTGNAGQATATDGIMGTASVRGGLNGGDASVFVSGSKDKVSFSANIMHSDMRPGETKTSNDRTQGDETITTASAGKPGMNFTMGNLSVSYTPDSLTTVGLTGGLNRFGLESSGSSHTSITGLQGPVTDYTSMIDMTSRRLGVNGSLSFGRRFTDRFNSNLSLIYQISHERNKADTESDFSAPSTASLNLADRSSLNRENTTEHILQADYTMAPRAGHTFETGAKMSWRSVGTNSTFLSADAPDLPSYTRYNNRSRIGALYASYALRAGNADIRAGVRYEHTWQKIRYADGQGADFSKNYGLVVPSASFSLPVSDSGNLGLTYNMRISRPGITYLNPYVDRSDPTGITYGNDRLDVEKSHNVGISYALTTSKLTLTARLTDSYTGNGIEQYSFYDNGMLNTTYGNIARRNNLSLNIFANWMAGGKTRLSFNGTGSYTDLRSDLSGLRNSGWQGSFMAGIQQQLPWGVKGDAFLIFSTRNHTLQGWNSGFRMLSLNLSKTFLDDRLTVSAGFRTGLYSGGKMLIENYSRNKDLVNHNVMRIPSMTFNIGVSYTFGSFKSARRNEVKTIESDFIESKSNMEQYQGGIGN